MAQRRLRLDAELVRRSMARSREQAREMIEAGRVSVNGHRAAKPATAVSVDADLVVRPAASGEAEFASRGGHKLAGALEVFVPGGLVVADRRCLDAGASTGGFTDVLLRAGAREVVAVDVGYGQLAWDVRNDPRVLVFDRTNIRDLTPELIGGPVDLVVGDLSFISLRLVLPAMLGVMAPDGDLALMVKPQFEVGREALGKGGVVREPALRTQAVVDVAGAAAALGWGAHAVTTSPLPGPSGNIEYFLWLRRGAARVDADAIASEVAADRTHRPPSTATAGVRDERLEP